MLHSGTALIDPRKVLSKLNLRSGMRVADFGSGYLGHFIFPLVNILGDMGAVYAVDIMKQALTAIEKRAKMEGRTNVHTVWSDVEIVGQTPISAGSLDGVLLTNVLFLMKDRAGAIAEANRLLKKGAFLLIIDWEKKLCSVGPEVAEQAIPHEVTELAKQSGFALEERFLAGDCHYGLIFRKS